MNPAIVMSLFSGDLKKHFAIVLATMVFIITLPVLAVFSMGGDVINFLSGTPSALSAEEQGFYMGGPVEGDTYAWGNCTYWAFANRLWIGKPISNSWGNANTWDENAMVDGYEIDHIPKVGDVMQSDEGALGHVAYVTNVDPVTGEWKISEMNAPHLNVVSTRTFDKASAMYYDFIHDRIGATQ